MALFKGLFGGGKTQPQDNWYDPLPQPGMEQPAQAGRQPSKALSILGVIGDAMQTWGGGQATFLPHLLDLRERTDRERQQLEMLKAKSAQDWTDFKREHDYKTANTPAPEPDQFTRHMIAAGIDPTSDRGKALYLQHVINMGDPTSIVPVPGRGTFVGPRSEIPRVMGLGTQEVTKPVGRLTPIQEGGGTGNGVGGFLGR